VHKIKVAPLCADLLAMRSVTALCVGFGTILGGFVPDLWGGSALGLASIVTGAVGGIAGLWLGLRLGA
jgi:hypothetical protein